MEHLTLNKEIEAMNEEIVEQKDHIPGTWLDRETAGWPRNRYFAIAYVFATHLKW